jgi:starch phosphorylase
MKAVLNGVPSLSILDGWWIEGCIEGVPGWAIGELPDPGEGGEDRLPLLFYTHRKVLQYVTKAYFR